MNRAVSFGYRIGGLLARALDRLLLTSSPLEWKDEESVGSKRRTPPAHGRRRRARSLVWTFLAIWLGRQYARYHHQGASSEARTAPAAVRAEPGLA